MGAGNQLPYETVHMNLCVCVTPNHFNKSKAFTIIHHIYSSVCTAAMFLLHAAIPPSRHNSKAMDMGCIPTVRPPLSHAHAPGARAPMGELALSAQRLGNRLGGYHAVLLLTAVLCVCVCVCVTPKSFKSCSNCEVQQ